MLDLRRILHLGKSPQTPQGQEPVTLVAIAQNPPDREALRQIADSFGWKISIVDSSSSAMALLASQPTPLVICDRDLTGEDWRDALSRIAALPQAVCVLLASGVMDEYLWHEAIRYHGYDVVAKPFQRDELRRAVTFAWSWRGWATRQYAEKLRKPSA